MLVSALLTAVVLQQQPVPPARRDTADTTRPAQADTSRQASASVGYRVRGEREPRRIPVTAQHRATAFRTPMARQLLERARVARMQQDSALVAYEATAYMRISAGMGFSRIGRDRLIFRHENATNVKWNRNVGAWIEVKGARTAIPIVPDAEERKEAENEIDDDMFPLPYYPGQEPLLSLSGKDMVRAQVDERDMVHPLAEGSEAYYTYAVGDSVTFRLPDGRSIELRELHVRPREPKWNVAVGSLWFDRASGQLVRAAYRLAVPLDVWAQVKEEEPDADEDIPGWVKPLISPIHAQISAIAVEYGLYQGRFWLPRLRSAEGDARVSFMRVPFRFDQSFRYSSVNGPEALPEIRIVARPEPPDTLTGVALEQWEDSVGTARRDARRARQDSVKKGLLAAFECDSAGMRTITRRASETGMRIATRIPCDREKLASAPELPKSIYDDGEEIFGSTERDALVKEALAMGAQPPLSIGSVPPELSWGLEYTRFNRVEGVSTGAMVSQNLGSGYTARVLGRIGHADLTPNVELSLERSNMSRTIRGGVYHRLVAANDWGNPLAFGSSLSALLFGRDEGFYFRATGAELEWTRDHGSHMGFRLFAERQREAERELERAIGARFIPNIAAQPATWAGMSARITDSYGLDPEGFRLFSDLRLEGAGTDSANTVYTRAAGDFTVTRGLGRFASALTLSAGTSSGVLPVQRQWYLGGAHTVRGQRADTSLHGNSYWLGRLEIGRPVAAVRPLLFGDIGWTGDRAAWGDIGRPMSGAGVGVSMLDGLFRLDLARGIYPEKKTRLYLYLDAKF